VPLTVRGVEARVLWGYTTAAALGAWTAIKPDDGGPWTLTATVVTSNAFALDAGQRDAQRPLTFLVQTAKGQWRWPVVTLQITGASLTATLGPKESPHG
jgi:hypothetical protein